MQEPIQEQAAHGSGHEPDSFEVQATLLALRSLQAAGRVEDPELNLVVFQANEVRVELLESEEGFADLRVFADSGVKLHAIREPQDGRWLIHQMDPFGGWQIPLYKAAPGGLFYG